MKKNELTSTIDAQKPQRLFYLLRLWREENLLNSGWRASLEITETGQRLGFGTLEELFGYLMDACECLAQPQEPAEDNRPENNEMKCHQ